MMNDMLRLSDSAIEKVQTEKLQSMLEMCSRGHPYYMNQWREAGVNIAGITSLSDLESLPLTPKRDLMENPESFRLKLPDLPLHERILWDVGYTTGSTGDPTPVYNTSHDYYAYLFQSKRVADISGIRSDDIIANLFPLTAAPMGAFVRSATNAYAVGATIFAALPGASHGNFDVNRSLDEAVALIELHRATILWGIPSFVRRVLMRAVEIKADFRAVRMCALTGEATSKPFREDLRHHLRQLHSAGTIMFDRYGSTEMGAFAQCAEDGPWHNPAPEIQLHEVVDPDTGKRLPDGERGALAVTHLDRRGTVLIRFLVGDIVSMVRGPCPVCGRFGDRLVGPVVRTKDLIKVKGMLINPSALLETMNGIPDIDEYQVLVRRSTPNDAFSPDELLVRIASRANHEALSAVVIERVQKTVQIRPCIEFSTSVDIYDPATQSKAIRFQDQRDSNHP